MKKRPLWVYVIAVVVVWAVILFCFSIRNAPRLHDAIDVCGGFLLGMLAMYIAVHVYRWE